MSLAELKYIEKALSTLTEQQTHLEMIAKLLEIEFTEILELKSIEYLNIVTRVKGEESLKEKILRRRYYKRYNDPKRLIYHLSDLIGVRIECRFQQDEYEIYQVLKQYFSCQDEKGYHYNKTNPNVKLFLSDQQPQKQKNGFKIFRIDGIITDTDTDLPFELQIKSLVNTFWSEIEHKIMYKNYNFLLMDELLTEMMHSIKNNLSLLDKQLLSIYQNVEQMNNKSDNLQREAIESVLTRLCNNVFSQKLKEQMGFNVNIKKDIKTIVKYTFLKPPNKTASFMNKEENIGYLLTVLERISVIANTSIEFNVPIILEREPVCESTFAKKLVPYFIHVMNKEFHWNLFFKILMTIEHQDNVGDFEKFLGFLEHIYQSTPAFMQVRYLLYAQLGDKAEQVIGDLMEVVANCIIKVDDISCIYEEGVEQINICLTEAMLKVTPRQLTDYDHWLEQKDQVLSRLHQTIISSLT